VGTCSASRRAFDRGDRRLRRRRPCSCTARSRSRRSAPSRRSARTSSSEPTSDRSSLSRGVAAPAASAWAYGSEQSRAKASRQAGQVGGGAARAEAAAKEVLDGKATRSGAIASKSSEDRCRSASTASLVRVRRDLRRRPLDGAVLVDGGAAAPGLHRARPPAGPAGPPARPGRGGGPRGRRGLDLGRHARQLLQGAELGGPGGLAAERGQRRLQGIRGAGLDAAMEGGQQPLAEKRGQQAAPVLLGQGVSPPQLGGERAAPACGPAQRLQHRGQRRVERELQRRLGGQPGDPAGLRVPPGPGWRRKWDTAAGRRQVGEPHRCEPRAAASSASRARAGPARARLGRTRDRRASGSWSGRPGSPPAVQRPRATPSQANGLVLQVAR
jgi:hypothetical protein